MADPAAQLTQIELELLPTIPPPNGLDFDFNGPHPWQKTAIIVTTLFVALALVSCCIRFLTKLRKLCKFSWDDCKSSPNRFIGATGKARWSH